MTLAVKELDDGDALEAIYHEPKYNEEAKQLDVSAEMGKHLLGLVHFGRTINFPYDQLIEHKEYSQGFIILARLRKSGVIAGKICGVIKEIYLFGKIQKVVYIFDLRVPTTIQKKGVGTFLLKTAEDISRDRGVTLQLMSINQSNLKIENLSNKLGWQAGCKRKIMNSSYNNEDPLITNKEEGFKLEFIEPKDVKEQSTKVDLALVNFDEISQSKSYLGMLRASTENSQAKLHIYKGDKEFGMVCKRFIFEPETYNHWYTWLFLIILLLTIPAYLTFTSFGKNFSVLSYGRLALGVVGLIIFSLVLFGLKFIMRMLNSPFIRVFGYSFKGNPEEEEKLCDQIFQMSRRYAGFTKSSIRLNEDPRAEYIPFLKGAFKGLGSTLFKYKYISKEKVERLYDENNFFDPRDL